VVAAKKDKANIYTESELELSPGTNEENSHQREFAGWNSQNQKFWDQNTTNWDQNTNNWSPTSMNHTANYNGINGPQGTNWKSNSWADLDWTNNSPQNVNTPQNVSSPRQYNSLQHSRNSTFSNIHSQNKSYSPSWGEQRRSSPQEALLEIPSTPYFSSVSPGNGNINSPSSTAGSLSPQQKATIKAITSLSEGYNAAADQYWTFSKNVEDEQNQNRLLQYGELLAQKAYMMGADDVASKTYGGYMTAPHQYLATATGQQLRPQSSYHADLTSAQDFTNAHMAGTTSWANTSAQSKSIFMGEDKDQTIEDNLTNIPSDLVNMNLGLTPVSLSNRRRQQVKNFQNKPFSNSDETQTDINNNSHENFFLNNINTLTHFSHNSVLDKIGTNSSTLFGGNFGASIFDALEEIEEEDSSSFFGSSAGTSIGCGSFTGSSGSGSTLSGTSAQMRMSNGSSGKDGTLSLSSGSLLSNHGPGKLSRSRDSSNSASLSSNTSHGNVSPSLSSNSWNPNRSSGNSKGLRDSKGNRGSLGKVLLRNSGKGLLNRNSKGILLDSSGKGFGGGFGFRESNNFLDVIREKSRGSHHSNSSSDNVVEKD